VAGQVVYRTTPEEFAAHLDALLDAGAHFIGGCCGTSPAFVAALQTRLEGLCGGRATEGKEG
jgi:5-methyltetrahydrofolate--homocysteine methyltransferase